MGKKSKSWSGIRSGKNIPDHISESVETIFWLKIQILWCGSGIFLTLDPGWKNSDPGFGINIPGPQHWNTVLKCFKRGYRTLREKNGGAHPEEERWGEEKSCVAHNNHQTVSERLYRSHGDSSAMYHVCTRYQKMVHPGQVCLVCVGTPDKSESRPPPVLTIHKKGESQSLYYYPRQIFETCSFMLCSTKSGGVPLKALYSEMDQA
jgi:hypothetical protein